VTRGSPAEKAGLKTGDVIIAINDKPIQDRVAAMAIIAALKPGMNANFNVTRDQKQVTIPVEIGKRPKINRKR
jgi:serine protease DegQ